MCYQEYSSLLGDFPEASRAASYSDQLLQLWKLVSHILSHSLLLGRRNEEPNESGQTQS